METTRTAVVAWRRALMLGITALIAALAASYAAPTEATALGLVDPYAVPSSYAGWATIQAQPCQSGTAGLPCISIGTGWQWTGHAWRQTTFPTPLRVYAYPYTGRWHWAWMQQTGWMAIETSRLRSDRCSDYFRC